MEQEDSQIVSIQIVMKESIYGFNGNKKSKFIKVTTALHNHLNAAKRILENGLSFGPFDNLPFSTYESNIALIMRFMVDTKVAFFNLDNRHELDRFTCEEVSFTHNEQNV